uniref:Kassinin-like peptide K-II n=1 Tax=Pseudophryne guentheri TaxID=30349 RepID=TKN2_PSEGU|nr:RecName: Full=Kassinin-like peptide K-II; AltName: Full=PG-KII [Pseudophryne guentheri]
QPNPDEFVGLM